LITARHFKGFSGGSGRTHEVLSMVLAAQHMLK